MNNFRQHTEQDGRVTQINKGQLRHIQELPRMNLDLENINFKLAYFIRIHYLLSASGASYGASDCNAGWVLAPPAFLAGSLCVGSLGGDFVEPWGAYRPVKLGVMVRTDRWTIRDHATLRGPGVLAEGAWDRTSMMPQQKIGPRRS